MKKEIIVINDSEGFMQELTSMIREIIKEELSNPRLKAKNKMQENVFLTTDELGEHLRISRSTINRLVNAGVIIRHKMGQRSLFNMKETETALIKVNI